MEGPETILLQSQPKFWNIWSFHIRTCSPSKSTSVQDPLEYNICTGPENKICHPEPGKWLKEKNHELEEEYGITLNAAHIYYLLSEITYQAIKGSINEKKDHVHTMHAKHYLPSNINTVNEKIGASINKKIVKITYCKTT